MIRLSTNDDVPRLNEIANHPSVFPFIAANDDPIDLEPIMSESIVFISDHGAIIFNNCGGGSYQFHTMFLPQGRGRHALKVARFCAQEMFTGTSAMRLVTYSPDDAPHSNPPRTFGFKPWFSRENVIRGVGAHWYKLDLFDWVMKSKACLDFGKNSDQEPTKDAAFYRFAGAAGLAILNDNIDKGLMIYNSWAVCAGHNAAQVINRDPLEINIGEANWQIAENKWRAEPCL